jgi:hypothetical protein
MPHIAEAAPAPKVKKYSATMAKAHLPAAPNKGTDDYRCFLLDPKVKEDSIIRSIEFIPLCLSLFIIRTFILHTKNLQNRTDNPFITENFGQSIYIKSTLRFNNPGSNRLGSDWVPGFKIFIHPTIRCRFHT